jgi:hypothetical protein
VRTRAGTSRRGRPRAAGRDHREFAPGIADGPVPIADYALGITGR